MNQNVRCLDGVRKVHIVGIGGISMSAIAKILVHRGYLCTGSDKTYNDQCAEVEKLGVSVSIGHEASNITDQDLVIYTAAVSEEIPEIARAKRLGIPVIGRAQFLGQLMAEYRDSVAVSGAHGKTTTTSMISHLLKDLLDPTVLVGGVLHDNHSNVVIGKGETFVHEACEFKDTFLSLRPRVSVILNIDEDHLDYFSGLPAIVASFRKFALATREIVVYFADDRNVAEAVSPLRSPLDSGESGASSVTGGSARCGEEGFSAAGARAVSFGTGDDAEYRVVNLRRAENATAEFDLEKRGVRLAHISLGVPGFVNWMNAAAAFVACVEMLGESVTPEIFAHLAARLGDFENTDRRFQRYGTYGGITVVDDFAHHPNEIRPAVETAKSLCRGKVIALFQPYTYSRTRELLDDFGACFAGVDALVVSDILGGREVDPGDIHARDVVRAAEAHGVKAYLSDTLEHAGDLAISLAGAGDMIVTMGCGNVYLAARYMDRKLKEESGVAR